MKNTIHHQEQGIVSGKHAGYSSMLKGFLLTLLLTSLWVINPLSAVSAVPEVVKDITPGTADTYFSTDRLQIGALLFFEAHDGVNGYELWRSDGTEAGTYMVKDIYPGSNGSSLSYFTQLKGILYFTANDGIHSTEFWRSDGTEDGTFMVKDIYPGSSTSSPAYLAVAHNTLFFRARENITTGYELWKSDGTTAGTVRVKDIYPGSAQSSYPSKFTQIDEMMAFSARSDATGYKLWATDGTENDTYVVWASGPTNPNYLVAINDVLFFSATGSDGDVELWKIEGQDYVEVTEINPTGSSYPNNLINVNGTLFFTASDGSNNTELWRSDGTPAGTFMVKDINASGPSEPEILTNVNGTLFFTADDGINGYGLWKSDGSAVGTVLVKDVSPAYLTDVNGTLFFKGTSATGGSELWESDGSEAGTSFYDINSGPSPSSPYALVNVNGTLFFSADNGIDGTELMKLEGTAPTISVIADQSSQVNTSIGPLAFTVSDSDTAPNTLSVSVSISTDDLPALSYSTQSTYIEGELSAHYTIRLWNVVSSQIGTAIVTISVSDGTSTSTEIFRAEWGGISIESSAAKYLTIQDAVTAAVNGDVILLAPGTYKGIGNRDINFLGKAITIKSTKGAEQTILDLERSGTGFIFVNGETASSVLDGLTLVNGFHTNGGAIEIQNSSPVIKNCVISNNNADSGGGIYSIGTSAPLIQKTFFHNNSATNAGGAAYFAGTLKATIEECTFTENKASNNGGGIGSLADIDISRSLFMNNTAATSTGGGIFQVNTFRITNSVFIGNSSGSWTYGGGGGIYVGGGPGTISHVSLYNNSAGGDYLGSGDGGGLEVISGTTYLSNSIIWGNTSKTATGKQISVSGTLHLDYSDLEGGTAEILLNDGGTIENSGTSIDLAPHFAFSESLQLLPDSPCIDTATNTPEGGLPTTDFAGNLRIEDGDNNGISTADMGAFEFSRGPSLAISPQRIEFHAMQGMGEPEGQIVSLVNSGFGELPWAVTVDSGAENWLRAEPVDGSSAGEVNTVTLHIESEALASMDPGRYTAVLTILDGTNNSVVLETVPVSLEINQIINVNGNGTGDYTTIQAGIDAAVDGDVVMISDGSYYEYDIRFNGKAITVTSENGPDYTIIDAGFYGRGFVFDSAESNSSILQGVTIQFGDSASGGGTNGGGILISVSSSATILNCRLQSNLASGLGGGIANYGSDVIIRNCEFISNTADNGGGLYLSGPRTIVENSSFTENNAAYGGGAYISGDDTLINNSIFSNNPGSGTADEDVITSYGGGIYISLSADRTNVNNSIFYGNRCLSYGAGVSVRGKDSLLTNNIFYENRALSSGRGGGAYVSQTIADTEILNCTFYNNESGIAGYDGLYVTASSKSTITNSLFWQDSGTALNSINLDSIITYTATSDATPAGTGNIHLATQPFVDPDNVDFRLKPTSALIDAGTDITWLFSDQRGSLRSIDGDTDGLAAFDIGAMEYSEYYGGIDGDLPTKAFANVRVGSSIIATNYGYSIEWDNRDPFPLGDRRIQQANQYAVNLALVNDSGMRHELGTYTVAVSQLGYSIAYTFGYEHIGDWQLRLEMASDPNQYVLSGPVSIQYKELDRYYWGAQIPAPAGADPTVRPDFNDDSVVFWSAETSRLYAIGGPKTLVITWYEDTERTKPIPVVANVTYPTNPQIYVAESMGVPLLPEDSPFEMVEMKFTDNDATVSANEFSATSQGWSVLLFRDNDGVTADEKEVFEVIRTLPWNHQDSIYSFDPDYPLEELLAIGTKAANVGHDDSCGDGYVLFEDAFYDGFGPNKSYDRTTRQGPVFAINRDITGLIVDENIDELDDLVVVWYEKSASTGVCWPYLPVRYDPQWPVLTGDDVIYLDAKLSDAHDQGTGPLDPAAYGLLENMVIYNQPDRSLPGFNPNEEHAAFFTAPESTDPGVFPLRNDINRTDVQDPDTYTSDPYVLLKFINPQTGIWDMKVFQVEATDGEAPVFSYENTAGNEINAPFPLNQMVYGSCDESSTTTPLYVLKDKDNKMFSFEGGKTAGVKYFYKLQPGFYYDLNNDSIQDKPDGSCIAWLDGYEGSSFDSDPIEASYVVDWPDTVPTLHIGETLVTAKTQPGESVGLPEIGAQCRVKVLYQESPGMVKLLNPLYEVGSDYPLGNPEDGLPPELKPKYDLGTGRWIFTALPYHIQTRLTYDAVASSDPASDPKGMLKLRGTYESGVGEPTLLMNVLSLREIAAIEAFTGSDPFGVGVINSLNAAAAIYPAGNSEILLKDADIKALSAGDAQDTGYVTLSFNNDEDCPAPTTLSVIKVGCPLYTGELKVIESENPFEEKVTMRHNGDFGGNSDAKAFEWQYMFTTEVTGAPEDDDPHWKPFTTIVPEATSTTGHTGFYDQAVDTVITGSGQQLLTDKWFKVRYYDSNVENDEICQSSYSSWTPPQLYEGWIKRVMKKINLFDQKVTDYHTAEANSLVSMISQAGVYGDDIALSDNPEYLQQLGIIEVYETLLKRGNSLSEGEDDAALNQARLFAANRLADLYMLLGNEAYADASDPTIGFSTESGQYGAEAASIFSFQNQLDSLLEEELVLLRGQDTTGVRPFYNRLIWNFTLGDGEVAYKENYNITDQITEDSNNDTYADTTNGIIDEFDAMVLFPQGHGDAWGHYLSAATKYYGLLKSVNFTWTPLTENILVAGVPVGVDYMDERKFMTVAAARAKTGAEIINLTYRQNYTEDPEGQWQGYKDTDPDRAWGVDGWAKRAGQAAYFDWAVGNAMLPSEYKTEELVATEGQTLFTMSHLSYTPGDNELEVKVNGQLVGADAYTETGSSSVTFIAALGAGDVVRFRVNPGLGIEKVDRTTVVEFWDVAGSYKTIQTQVDQANVGLNPLGLAKNAIPFDIDPDLVANGQTHFEQIYSRAAQAMNNSIAVFNHANEATQLLRRQQDSLADFQRNIENMEADYNKRLIEVYGYPYGDDCGSNKTYATSYCQTGPDLFHYMYVDASKLMGLESPTVHEFDVTMQGEYEVSLDGSLTSTEKQVTFHVATDSRYGIVKPTEWLIPRKASGEIQFARSDLLQFRGRFDKAIIDYGHLLAEIESQADLIGTQYDVNEEEISILNKAKNEKTSINRSISNTREALFAFNTAATLFNLVSKATSEAIPTVTGVIVGTSNGVVTDAFSAGRGAALAAGAVLMEVQNIMADVAGLAELGFQHDKEILAEETSIELTTLRSGFAIEQQLKQLESLFRSEVSLRHELYVQAEGLQQSGSRYLGVLAKGEQLIRDRLRFRKQTAAQIVDYRYKDMSFRIFRNDALEKYRAQFDMAGMYVYLAAKAYDYDTTLLDYNTMAGQSFMTDIVRQRTIGLIQDGQPLTGTGLADPMKRMWQNFQVLKPQLGFNNPQIETNRFSLRQELFRIKMETGSNQTWKQALRNHWEEDLWNIPEFRRYCRPFASEGVPQPGLVIPFTTTITPGLNFFKWPLGGGDSYYSSTNFATKIRSVGVWFTNYNTVGLAQTPRIYLVPVGEDVLRTPSSSFKDIRTWQVVDQKLPLPFPIDSTELENDPAWIPTVNTVLEEMFELRKHSDFRAYHDSGYLNESEMQYDSRLIGRSVWNSKWLLIIPGQSLQYDPIEGLDTFIDGPEVLGGTGERTGNGIFDIKLFFETYGYSGN